MKATAANTQAMPNPVQAIMLFAFRQRSLSWSIFDMRKGIPKRKNAAKICSRRWNCIPILQSRKKPPLASIMSSLKMNPLPMKASASMARWSGSRERMYMYAKRMTPMRSTPADMAGVLLMGNWANCTWSLN